MRLLTRFNTRPGEWKQLGKYNRIDIVIHL
jgi:hypothetical protein